MIQHNEHFLGCLNARLQSVNRLVDLGSQFSPSLLNVILLINVQSTTVRAELVPNFLVNETASFFLEVLHRVGKGVRVGSERAVVEPGDSFETNSHVNDFDVQLFARAIMERLILHEHHISDFEAVNKVLNRGSQVATASPDILHKGDLIRINTESLCEPAIVELNALFFEEVVLVWVVEHLNAQHDKAGVVSASDANVVEIVESSAKLGANERVCWRVQLTRHTVRLEAEDASSDIIDVVAPSGHHWVPLDRSARNSS